jgi:hypothetical protein
MCQGPPLLRALAGGCRAGGRYCRAPCRGSAVVGSRSPRRGGPPPRTAPTTAGETLGTHERKMKWERLLDCSRRREVDLVQLVGPTMWPGSSKTVVTRVAMLLDKLQSVAKKSLPYVYQVIPWLMIHPDFVIEINERTHHDFECK